MVETDPKDLTVKTKLQTLRQFPLKLVSNLARALRHLLAPNPKLKMRQPRNQMKDRSKVKQVIEL